jgi:hypothetical protein
MRNDKSISLEKLSEDDIPAKAVAGSPRGRRSDRNCSDAILTSALVGCQPENLTCSCSPCIPPRTVESAQKNQNTINYNAITADSRRRTIATGVSAFIDPDLKDPAS